MQDVRHPEVKFSQTPAVCLGGTGEHDFNRTGDTYLNFLAFVEVHVVLPAVLCLVRVWEPSFTRKKMNKHDKVLPHKVCERLTGQ